MMMMTRNKHDDGKKDVLYNMYTVQPGYPSSTEWLNQVLVSNDRVGAYPNYVSSGTVDAFIRPNSH